MKSPGVPAEAPLVAAARERGVPVWSEVELGARILPNPLVGVTGTNGKTTTTELLGAIFRAADRPVETAGNVGRPLTGLDGEIAEDAWIVCELSSFQLEDVHTLRPRVAVLLNLEPDHLDRHPSLEDYARGEAPDLREPGGGRHRCRPASASGPCRARRGGSSSRADDALARRAAPARSPQPRERRRRDGGRARRGHPDDAIAARARELPRRPAPARAGRGEVDGVTWVNDSKATNVAAARPALEAYEDEPVHLILGGSLKGEDFAPLAQAIGPNVLRVYVIGEASDELAAALTDAGDRARAKRRPRDRRAGRGRRRRARRRRPPLAGLRELRPVPRLRGARRALPRARARARMKARRDAGGHAPPLLEFHLLVLVTLGLVAFGLVMVYSASSGRAAVVAQDPAYYLKRQGDLRRSSGSSRSPSSRGSTSARCDASAARSSA